MGFIQPRAMKVGVLGLACAWAVLWTGYALACSPGEASPWYTLSVSIDAKSLPKGFAVKGRSIEKLGDRDCVLADDGRSLDGYQLQWLERLATNDERADGRPANVKLPKADRLELETHCDRQHYVTQGRISYRSDAGSTGVWGRHVELDLEKVGHLIATRPWWGGSTSGDLYVDRQNPAEGFCTMSVERIVDDGARMAAQVFGTTSIPLTLLTGVSEYGGANYPETIKARAPPASKTFKVFVDCYSSRTIVKARIDYALNKSYEPHRRAQSTEYCPRWE